MSKHTPTPWPALIDIPPHMLVNAPAVSDDRPMVECCGRVTLSFENYQRARACVNALDVFDDPEASIRALCKAVRYMRSTESVDTEACYWLAAHPEESK